LTQSVGGWSRSIALPALALAAGSVGFIARMTRSAMLEVLSQDYVRTAKAEGLPRAVVILRHGLPNALIPILTVIGILTGGLLGGAVVIEQVFSLPGVGRLLIGAILSRDLPVIQGGLLLIAVIYLAVNLLIDVVYVVIDPRIRVN
jgi:peptide/nickel transport system permease protein